jgi:hypothetical protein
MRPRTVNESVINNKTCSTLYFTTAKLLASTLPCEGVLQQNDCRLAADAGEPTSHCGRVVLSHELLFDE